MSGKTLYDILTKECKTEKSKISLDEGFMPVSPFIAYVAFKKRVFNAFKNNKLFQVFRALKGESMKLKGKTMVGAEKTKATAGGTSKDTVYRFTTEQISVMAEIYNKYGKKLVDDILEFRRNVLAPYQVIKRLIKSSSRVAPKDITGISKEDYEAAIESGKKKISGRGEVYFKKVEDIRAKLDAINSQVENLEKLRRDFSGSSPVIDYNIVNKVFKKFDIAEHPEGYSREELKRVYDEITKNYKVLLSASQQADLGMEDFAKMKELRQRQRALWAGKTVDLTKTASNEFFKKGSFNVALAKYFFAREIIYQLTRPASVFNVFKKTYTSIISEMIDKYLEQRKELLNDLASMKGKAQFSGKETKVYGKLPHIKHFSKEEKDYYLKVRPEDFPAKTINIPRSQEMIDAERKIENEIKKFEHSLKQVISPEDFEKLRRYRVIGNLISVKELREPDDLFKSKEEIIADVRGEEVEEATSLLPVPGIPPISTANILRKAREQKKIHGKENVTILVSSNVQGIISLLEKHKGWHAIAWTVPESSPILSEGRYRLLLVNKTDVEPVQASEPQPKLEETTKDDFGYFMTEGCAIFALALQQEKGTGEFFLVVEDVEKSDYGLPYDIYHVLLKIDANFYDVYGKQTLESVQKYFHKSSLRLIGPYNREQFMSKFVGSGDDKPLYGPTEETVEMAMKIIKGQKVEKEDGREDQAQQE